MMTNKLSVLFRHSSHRRLKGWERHQSFAAGLAIEVIQNQDRICMKLIDICKVGHLQTDPLFGCLKHTPCLFVHLNEAGVVISCVLISLEEAEDVFSCNVVRQTLHANKCSGLWQHAVGRR